MMEYVVELVPRPAPNGQKVAERNGYSRLVNVKVAAQIFGMSRKCLYSAAAKGSLPPAMQPIRIGIRALRWDIGGYERWLEEERKKAAGDHKGENA